MKQRRRPLRGLFGWISATLLAAIVGFTAIYCWPAKRVLPIHFEARDAENRLATARTTTLQPSPPRVAAAAVESGVPDDVTPAYYPRDPKEWQGMLVGLTYRAMCDGPVSCGLAAACIDGTCGPCKKDGDCGRGELCVLDHCVVEDKVECRSRRDCAQQGALCVLTGYSPGTRGNADMRAQCVASTGGHELAHDAPLVKGLPASPSPVNASELLESVRDQATQGPHVGAGN